jgi:hypothetical protein
MTTMVVLDQEKNAALNQKTPPKGAGGNLGYCFGAAHFDYLGRKVFLAPFTGAGGRIS